MFHHQNSSVARKSILFIVGTMLVKEGYIILMLLAAASFLLQCVIEFESKQMKNM